MDLKHTPVVMIVAMTLTGCGGGGTLSTPVAVTPTSPAVATPPPTPPPFTVPQAQEITAGLITALAKAAGNEPAPGSVTQSSDGTNSSQDTVAVQITSENGALTYDVSYDGARIVSTRSGQATTGLSSISGRPKGTELFQRVQESGELRGIQLYRSMRAHDAEAGSAAGDLWVAAYTDYHGDDDTDYLAGGVWMFAPDDATRAEDYEFGAFGNGNDPFMSANVMPLTGTATYEGSATGVYADRTANRNDLFFFDARASLTADFGAGNGLGTIRGSIDTFKRNGGLFEGNPGLILETANIGNTNHGFFTGNTTMSFEGSAFTGKWGGQFFGNGTSATDQPGAVGGTFGAENGTSALVGVFSASKQ